MIPINRIKAWLIGGRYFVLPWMFCNTLLGICLAGFDFAKWMLAFGIISSILIAAHYLNGWRDFVKGVDKINGSTIKPYTAGSQVLPRGWLSLKTFKLSTMGFLVLSVILLILAPIRIDVYLLYALGLTMALTYTDILKPRGLGEIGLFLGHGFGSTTFAFSLVKPIDLTGISAGILLGFFAGIIYTIDQWQDVETDFAKKVKDLAYRAFEGNMSISQLWYFVLIGSVVLQFGMVALGWLPLETLITIFMLIPGYATGIYLDYRFDKGVLLALLTMWLYATTASLGVLFI